MMLYFIRLRAGMEMPGARMMKKLHVSKRMTGTGCHFWHSTGNTCHPCSLRRLFICIRDCFCLRAARFRHAPLLLQAGAGLPEEADGWVSDEEIRVLEKWALFLGRFDPPAQPPACGACAFQSPHYGPARGFSGNLRDPALYGRR